MSPRCAPNRHRVKGTPTMSSHLSDLRRAASSLGVPWNAVEAAYAALREADDAGPGRLRELRQTAWYIANARMPRKWPFWRHGFASQWGKRFEQSDYTVVPGYDSLQTEIAGQFPEWDDPDKLWAFLFSPYERRKTRRELWDEAFALACDGAPTEGCEYAEVPF